MNFPRLLRLPLLPLFLLLSSIISLRQIPSSRLYHRLSMTAMKTEPTPYPTASDVVYQLLCQASQKKEDDFVYIDSEGTSVIGNPYAASVKTLIEGKTSQGKPNTLAEDISQVSSELTDIETVRICCALGSLGVKAIHLENQQAWQGLEERVCSIDFYGLKEEMDLHNEYLSSKGFDHNQSPAILSHPSPFMELLLGMTKMGVTWGKLSRAARYALIKALDHEMSRYKHFAGVKYMSNNSSDDAIEVDVKRLPSMATSESADVQQHVRTSTKWTRSRTIFPLVSLLGLIKADYSDFSPDLRKSFENCLIMSLKSPPPFFSLANMVLSLARMKMQISEIQPTLAQTLTSCITKNMHTVRRSVYWKLLAGISSMGFKWPSMDVKTTEILQSPMQLFSMNVRVTSKEISIVLNSLKALGCDWHVLQCGSQQGLLMAINECLQNYMSPHELSIIVNSLGATSLTWKELPPEMQKYLRKAIYLTAPSMKSWDISQLILGLGMMEAPTSFVTAGSPLEDLLVANAKLFGPSTIPGLVQGVSLLKTKSKNSDALSSKVKDTLFQIVDKWSGKMTAMSLFDSLYALSLLFQCEMSELPLEVDLSSQRREIFLFGTDVLKKDMVKTLDDLKKVLPTIQPTNVPNTLFFCYRIGSSVETLNKAFIWNDLTQWIEVWAQRHILKHEKITMLFNALEKIKADGNNIPESTQRALLSVLSRELPTMDPRQVSNNLYYLARMKFRSSDELRRVSTLSFFSSCHLMESSEFANGFWALIDIFKMNKADKDFNQKELVRGFIQQRYVMNARDLSTLTTSLKSTGHDVDTIPPDILEIIYDAILRVDMDATSVSLLLFSLGGMKFELKELPSVVRSTLRQAMYMFFTVYTPRELFWVIIGCSRMKIMWESFDEESKKGFSLALAQNLEDPSLKRPSIMYIFRAMTKISVEWEELSSEARMVTECCTRLALRDKSTDDNLVVEFLTSISRMQIEGSFLQRRTRNAMLTRINRIDSEILAPGKLLQVVQALVSLKFDIQSLPKGIVTHIRENFLQVFGGVKPESYMVIAFWRALRDLKFRWSDLQNSDKTCVAYAALMILQRNSPSLLTSCVHELRHLGVDYNELVQYCPDFGIELDKALDASYSKGIQNTSLIRSSYARKNENLLKELTMFGKFYDEKASDGLRVNKENILRKQVPYQYKKLNDGMSNLSDQEVVRAVFMLGQRPRNKKIPIVDLISSGTLRILDRRLSKIFEESCNGLQCKVSTKSTETGKGILVSQGVTDSPSGVSSAGLIAVLVSLGKMGIKGYHLRISLDSIITYFTYISGNIDRRAFLAIIRAFHSLGIEWNSFSSSHRLAFASGIARAASTSPASRIPIILKCLVDLHVPWKFLHENIPLVLRYIIFRLFTSVVTYDRTGSGIKVSQRAYLETIEYLAAMRATYNCLGSKASVAMLTAAETSLLADPALSSRFIKAVGIVCEDAPPEFWRGLSQDVKVSLKTVFETAVYGMLMSKPDSLLLSTVVSGDASECDEDTKEQILIVDFKDSDRFLPFLTFMDVDIDVSSRPEEDDEYEFQGENRDNHLQKQRDDDQEQAMYNNLINESGEDEPTLI